MATPELISFQVEASSDFADVTPKLYSFELELILQETTITMGIDGKQLKNTTVADGKLVELYTKADGTRAFTADQSMGGFKLTNIAAPTAAGDASTKSYVDSVAAGFRDFKESVTASTVEILDNDADITGSPAYDSDGGTSLNGQITATLAVSGTLAIDGVTLLTGDRLLVKNEGLGTAEVHSVDTVADVAGSLGGTYWVFYTNASTAYYVWYDVDNGDADPAPSPPAGVSFTGIEVDITANDTAATVASNTDTSIDAALIGASSDVTSNALTVTNSFGGNVTDVADGAVSTGFTFGTDVQGTGLGADANGLYSVTIAGTSLTLDRTTDFDADAEVSAGAFAFVDEGTSNADSGWVLATNDPIVIGGAGGTSLTFTQFSGAGSITAGAGLDQTGSTLFIGDINRGIQVNANDLEIDGSEMVSTTGGLQENGVNSWQIEVKLDQTTGGGISGLRVGTNGLGVDDALAGNGLSLTDGSAMVVLATNDSVGVTGSGLTSAQPAKGNKSMTASVTTGDGDQATATTVAVAPVTDGWVGLAVNGMLEPVGDGTKVGVSAYISGDSGTTARAWNAVVAGDTIHWNGSVSGYQLAATDRLDLLNNDAE